MDDQSEKHILTGDDIEYLHINEETTVNPSYQSRILISELWKLCLLHLYGGSKTQRKWCGEIYQSVKSNIMAEKEEDKVFQSIECIEEEEYLDKEEFTEQSKLILTSLNNDGTLEGKYQVLSKDLIKLVVSQGIYDARFRTALKTFTSSLEVDWEEIDRFEQSLVEELVKIRSDEEERERRRQRDQRKKNLKRAFVIGLTAVGGGAILALSAGLAAPLIGAGAVAVLGSGSAAIFTGVSGLAVITSIFGAAGAGLAGYKMTKRIGKIEQFEFGALTNGKHLHVTLAVSGFCGAEDEGGFSTPWQALDNSTEQYYLKWEGKYLRRLGSSIIDFVKREAMQAAVKGILKYTALRAVLKSIAWPLTLISAANLIDNPWNVCTQRSKETGIQLAHVLLSRHQGYRPITLIGFSLGARAIFYCLQTMLNEKDFQGIVEDVVLIGAPVGVCREEWEAFESVISGTLYNCYSRSDWLLKFVYRAASVQVGDIAGLGPIDVTWPRLVNIDLTDMVNSHSEYAEPTVVSDILQLIGYKTKPVEAIVPATAVKMPHTFVKEISKTPTKILPQSFSLNSKEGKQPQEELTTEEQETLDRLTSCQGKNMIDSLKTKGGFWKNDDSDGNDSENNSPVQQSGWQKVVSIAKRGSNTWDRKMLVGPDLKSVDDGTLQLEKNNSLRHVEDAQRSDAKDYLKDVGSKGSTQCVFDAESRNPESNDQISFTAAGEQSSRDCISIGQSSLSSDQTGEGQITAVVHDDQGLYQAVKTENYSVLVTGSPTDDDFGSDINDSLQQDEPRATDTTKLDPPPGASRTERSRSSGDIRSHFFARDQSRLTPNKNGSQKDFMMIPGKELFNKVRKNVKFALPSPTLTRHQQETSKSNELDAGQNSNRVESNACSFPRKALRKMSFPGSL